MLLLLFIIGVYSGIVPFFLLIAIVTIIIIIIIIIIVYVRKRKSKKDGQQNPVEYDEKHDKETFQTPYEETSFQ